MIIIMLDFNEYIDGLEINISEKIDRFDIIHKTIIKIIIK